MKKIKVFIVLVVLAISVNAQTNCDSWAATSTVNAPTGRDNPTAIWTGTEMIIWGCGPTGGRYNPLTDSWTSTSLTNAPIGRCGHSAVWTGTEMIIWGGDNGYVLNTGGKYNPITDTWISTNTTNVPMARGDHSAVWTGSEMIVWGGTINNNGPFLNSGGKYNPVTNSWTATSLINAPSPRSGHEAIWTGTEMVVWGGRVSVGYFFNTGGKYNPITDTWISTSITNAPSPRGAFAIVWTGVEMIVWGGYDGGTAVNTGARYNPISDSWIATDTANAPSPRERCEAVWTECSEMLVYGGNCLCGVSYNQTNTGGKYNPITNSWTTTTTTNAPIGRSGIVSVWTGSELIVWGGSYSSNGSVIYPNAGDRYTICCGNNVPSSAIAVSSTICNGQSSTLGIIGGSLELGANWNWYTGSCGGTYVISGATPIISPTITTTYWVRAEGTSSTSTCVSIMITVGTGNPSILPSNLIASQNTVCVGYPTSLSFIGGTLGTGATWNWYSGSCGGTFISTETTIIQNPVSNTLYYVRAEGLCYTTTCLSILIDIDYGSIPPSSITSTQSIICIGDPTTIYLNGGMLDTGAIWNWYSGSCGGTFIGIDTLITVIPTYSTTYYVRAEGACNTTSCVSITLITVAPSTAATSAIANPPTITSGASSTISINGGNLSTYDNWNWYSGFCGGTFIASGASIIQSTSVDTTYWVRAEGICNPTSCVSVTVCVFPVNVNTILETTKISLNPNPTNNTLNIANAENSDISIYNMLGEVVLKTKCSAANATINVSDLSTGTYIIKIVLAKNVVTKQLIIGK